MEWSGGLEMARGDADGKADDVACQVRGVRQDGQAVGPWGQAPL